MKSEVDFVVGEVYDFATIAAFFEIGGHMMMVVGFDNTSVNMLRMDSIHGQLTKIPCAKLRLMIKRNWANKVV